MCCCTSPCLLSLNAPFSSLLLRHFSLAGTGKKSTHFSTASFSSFPYQTEAPVAFVNTAPCSRGHEAVTQFVLHRHLFQPGCTSRCIRVNWYFSCLLLKRLRQNKHAHTKKKSQNSDATALWLETHPLKDVLVIQVLEDSDAPRQPVVQFRLRHHFGALLQK